MNETAEGHSGCTSQERSLPAPSSTQTWLPAESPLRSPWTNERDQHHHEMQSSPPPPFYEELFCTSQTSNIAVPLTGALMASSGPQSHVVKQGYLGKLDRNHRRYFVLRAGSHAGPSRLEWYKNQEKFTAVEKSAGKAVLFDSSKQGVIYLRCCLGVSRSGSARNGRTVALYAKDQTMVLVVEDQWEQEDWYLAVKKLIEEEREDEEYGEGFDEEDDGYCTLPPAAFFKEVWPITVKPIGLGCTKSLAGESRLCLTGTSLILVRVTACSNLPSVTIPLLSVRRFGHLDGSFYLELGRSAPNGPGEIWMGARDQGNPAVAQHIHEVVRETVRALRALPDFSRSPTSNHNPLQTRLALKRCRPKHRSKPVNVRPPGSRLAPPLRNPEIQESPTKCYLELNKTEPESTLSSSSHPGPLGSRPSSVSETGSYVEMKMIQHLPANKGRENDCRRTFMATGHHCSVGMESWEAAEEQALGYMMMSPPALPQDDYVTMTSPHKHNRPPHPSPSSSPQTFNCSETEAGQSQMSCLRRPQEAARRRRRGAQTWASSSPVRSDDRSGLTTPSGPDQTRPVQARPNSGTGRSSRAASERRVRRYRLSLCLPSCLRAGDGY
ncbi:hypothetical protein VZT92_017816 [Zoarces viviparus]|uniref:PH domain-containing protein n=1 Tax=Zoarces viviparus TaxID=48416 RepID=A0AAW1ENX6_ZOAVI